MRKFILFLLGIAVVACTEISYKEPQPKGVKPLSEIPTKLQGKYLMDDKDTVYLFDKGLRGKDQGKEEVMYLSDSIVMKEYKGNYFISYRDGNFWLLRIMKVRKNGDIDFLVMDNVPEDKVEGIEIDSVSENINQKKTEVRDDSKRKEFIEKLSKEIPVMEIESHYIIDPSPKKLNSLIKKGFFKQEKEKAWLKKIN